MDFGDPNESVVLDGDAPRLIDSFQVKKRRTSVTSTAVKMEGEVPRTEEATHALSEMELSVGQGSYHRHN
jgi:hypothetical protein